MPAPASASRCSAATAPEKPRCCASWPVFPAPTKAASSFFGKDHNDRAARSLTGIIGHGIAIYDELSAYENLKLYAAFYALPDPHRSALEWLERTALDRVKDGPVREFSRGMRQRLAVARAFLHNPELLLLDEPFTSLDDRAIALLQGLLRDALAAGGTVVMSTHQLREAMDLASHVVLLTRGRIAHRGERTPEMLADTGWLYRTYGEALVKFLRQTLTIAGKDLRSELRTKEALNASLSFALVILLLFSFAFDPTSDMTREISGGLLWLVFAFAGAPVEPQLCSRTAQRLPRRTHPSPLPGAALLLGKVLANYVLLLGIECVCLPVFGIFYNVRWTLQPAWLALVLLLGTWGMTVVGTVFSALTVNVRLRELMLPMLGLSGPDPVPDGVDAPHHADPCRTARHWRRARLVQNVSWIRCHFHRPGGDVDRHCSCGLRRSRGRRAIGLAFVESL